MGHSSMGLRTTFHRAGRIAGQIVSQFTVLYCALVVSTASGNAIPWATDLETASEQAAKTNAFVLVVDLPKTAPSDQATAAANDAFLNSSLGSPEQLNLIERHFAPVLRYVGIPNHIHYQNGDRSHIQKQAAAKIGRPVVYFCTADLRVLHFVVGYVGANRLVAATQWTIDNARLTRNEAAGDATQWQTWLGTAHRDTFTEFMERSLEKLSQRLRNSRSKQIATDGETVRSVVHAVSLLRQQRALELIGKNEQGAEDPAIVRFAALDGQLCDAGHLTLSLLPLARLDKLEQHVYEILADGHCYTQHTPRIKAIQAHMQQCAARGQPVLCVVHQRPTTPGELSPTSQHQQYLDHPAVKRRLSNFEIIPVLKVELSALIHVLGQQPIELNTKEAILFAAYDRRGKRTGVVCADEVLPLLVRYLRDAAS